MPAFMAFFCNAAVTPEYAVHDGPRPCCDKHRAHPNASTCTFAKHPQADLVTALADLRRFGPQPEASDAAPKAKRGKR